MTYQEREEIFSKEVLHINDVAKLMDCSYSEACNLIKTWKRKLEFKDKKLRLEVAGRLHILDYFDVMGINPDHPGDRYFKKRENTTSECSTEEVCLPNRRSVCV